MRCYHCGHAWEQEPAGDGSQRQVARHIQAEPPPRPQAERPRRAEAPRPAEPMAHVEPEPLPAPEPELEPMQSLVEQPPEPATDEIYPDDLPDPKPFPGVFTAAEIGVQRARRSGGAMKIVGIFVLVMLLLLGGGLFFSRTYIAKMWPPATDYYAMIGLSTEPLSAGLDIRDVCSERGTDGEVDALIVHGTVANVADGPNAVPNIRVALFDAANDVVQTLVLAPRDAEVQPGSSQTFRAVIRSPSPLARRLEVTFTADPISAN